MSDWTLADVPVRANALSSTIVSIPTAIETSSDPSAVPEVPLQNEFFRHTSLSRTRLQNQLVSIRSQPPILETEKTIHDIKKIPTTRRPKTTVDPGATQGVTWTSMIIVMGITTALLIAYLVIATLAFINNNQQIQFFPYGANAGSFVKSNSQWLFCDGTAVSRTKYSALFQAISTTYGAGNSVDTFNLPDLRSRFLLGSTTSADVTLASGGNKTRILTVTELPAHTHNTGTLATQSDGAHTHSTTQISHNHGGLTGTQGHPWSTVRVAGGSNYYVYSSLMNQAHSINSDTASITIQTAGVHTHGMTGATASEGQGQGFDVMPPNQTVHYVIRT